MTGRLKAAVLLLVLVVQCFYMGLGEKPMYKIQEVRVAETAREMIANQDWLIPYFGGEIRLRKPPLTYWLTAASYTAFGAVTEFTARFASATFAGLLVFALYYWVRRHLDAESALISVVCLVTSYMGLRYFRSAETDAVLLFFVSAACLLSYQLLYVGVNRSRVFALFLCMGLGFLTKGPAALAMPLATMFVLGLRDRRYAALKSLANPLGLILLVLLAFGWYATIYLKVPDMATHWVGEEIDATYVTGRRAQPFYWYAANVFQFYAPWSLFIVPAAIWYWKTRPHTNAVRFALVWLIATFIILSLNINKQTQYALLLAPPLSILLGHYLASARGRYARVNRFLLYGLVAVAIVAVPVALWKLRDDINPLALALLLIGIVLPFALAKALRMELKAGYTALLLTGLISSMWIYGQSTRYTADGNEASIKATALAAKDQAPLYIYGDTSHAARVSFYTQKVIAQIQNIARLERIVAQAGQPIYLIAEQTPPWPDGIEATEIFRQGNLHLWQLRAAAAPDVPAGAAFIRRPSAL